MIHRNVDTYEPSECTMCEDLVEERNQIVNGQGGGEGGLMFIGEAPGCFTPGTPVMTEHGSVMIEGNDVPSLISDGNCVQDNLSYTVEGEMCGFRVSRYPTYTCTPDHEFLVRYRSTYKKNQLPDGLSDPEWLSIQDIESLFRDDFQVFFLVPKAEFSATSNLKLNLGAHKTGSRRHIDNQMPDYLDVDEDIAFLIGAYIGDGHSNFSSGAVRVTFSEGYKESYVPRIKQAFRKFGTGNVKERREGKRVSVKLFSRTLCELFRSLCGEDCYEKRIPKLFYEAEKNLVDQMFLGWYVADGAHNRENPKQKITTVSEKLAWDAVSLALKHNILLGVRTNDCVKENEVPIHSVVLDSLSIHQLNMTSELRDHDIEVTDLSRVNPMHGECDDYFYLRLKSVDRREYSGQVYDKTTVKGSYQIPFVAHNSNEDQSGVPFIGKSGQKLRKLLHKLGVEKEEARITNMIRCRPPGNRDPKKEEIWACEPYLRKEIEHFDPDVICTLGAFATKRMLQESISMKAHAGKVRKKPLSEIFEDSNSDENIRIVPSYHPAAMFYGSGDTIEKRFEEAVTKAVELSVGVDDSNE